MSDAPISQSTDTTKDLLPCPFCGGPAFLVPDALGVLGPNYVQCDALDCSAYGPSGDTNSEAIAAWNRRSPDRSSDTPTERSGDQPTLTFHDWYRGDKFKEIEEWESHDTQHQATWQAAWDASARVHEAVRRGLRSELEKARERYDTLIHDLTAIRDEHEDCLTSRVSRTDVTVYADDCAVGGEYTDRLNAEIAKLKGEG